MPDAVDERREDDDVEDGMRQRRDQTRTDPQEQTQERGAQTGTDDALREDRAIQPVLGEVRRELPDRVAVPRFAIQSIRPSR